MPDITFVHYSHGTEPPAERGAAIWERLEAEKERIAALYVVAPDFSGYYSLTWDTNLKDYIVRMPYKFKQAPVRKA